jgi:hypothetical protein
VGDATLTGITNLLCNMVDNFFSSKNISKPSSASAQSP